MPDADRRVAGVDVLPARTSGAKRFHHAFGKKHVIGLGDHRRHHENIIANHAEPGRSSDSSRGGLLGRPVAAAAVMLKQATGAFAHILCDQKSGASWSDGAHAMERKSRCRFERKNWYALLDGF